MSISHLRCENRTCEVQAADAFSKRSCDFKTHLRLQNASATSTSQVRFSYRRCDFKTQMQRSCCVWKMTGCDSSNQTGNSLRGFIRNIINLMVYVFLFLCFPPIYIHIPIYMCIFNPSIPSSTEKVFVIVHVVIRSGYVLCILFFLSCTIIFCRFHIC